MEEIDRAHHGRWAVVFVVGLLLHAYAAIQSDLGLDAHVRLNGLNDAASDGQDLSWGSPRISGGSSENTTTVYDGYIPPWNTDATLMKLTAIVSMVLVAAVVSIRPRRETSAARFEPMWGALLMLSPVLLFSTSRGYDEAPLALLMALGVVGFWFNRGETPSQQRLNGVLMATSLLLVMIWKGFSPLACFVVWLMMLALTEGWIVLVKTGRYTNEGQWMGSPWKTGATAFGAVYLGITLFGLASSAGTFSIVADQPSNFLIASLFALLDTAVLYLLVGCLFWPFFACRLSRLRAASGPGLTMLAVYISAVLAGLVAYVAALWTLEATLWNMGLANVMVVLGNNGRYATLLLVPLVALLRWDEPSEPSHAPQESKLAVRAVALVLPFILFTTLIGHQLWSEDAGEVLAQSWSEGDDAVLLIAPESMAMHHLYVVKTHLDLDGSQGIQGWWANVEDAPNLLANGDIGVDFVLVAPGTTVDFDTTSWELVRSENVPVSVPGGIQGGTWSLYRFTA